MHAGAEGGCNCGVECSRHSSFFLFQAEDGIRDHCVTGVQTCALPISPTHPSVSLGLTTRPSDLLLPVCTPCAPLSICLTIRSPVWDLVGPLSPLGDFHVCKRHCIYSKKIYFFLDTSAIYLPSLQGLGPKGGIGISYGYPPHMLYDTPGHPLPSNGTINPAPHHTSL